VEHTAVALAAADDKGEVEHIVVEVAAVVVAESFSAVGFVAVVEPSEEVPEASVAVEIPVMIVVVTTVQLIRKIFLELY
jgi:hypothetical protein